VAVEVVLLKIAPVQEPPGRETMVVLAMATRVVTLPVAVAAVPEEPVQTGLTFKAATEELVC